MYLDLGVGPTLYILHLNSCKIYKSRVSMKTKPKEKGVWKEFGVEEIMRKDIKRCDILQNKQKDE